MSYKKPVLAEIYVEAFFVKDALPVEKLFDVGNEIKKLGLSNIEVTSQFQITIATEGEKEESVGSMPRLKCWDSDKKNLVQVSKDLMVVNQIGEYLGWDKFKNLFRDSLETIKKVIPAISCRSLALHTADKFVVPIKDFTIDRYLNVGPQMPSWYKGVKSASDISMGKGFLDKDGENYQFKASVRPSPENVNIHLVSVFHKKMSPTGVPLEALEELHKESNISFESVITEITRTEVMGGLKEHAPVH